MRRHGAPIGNKAKINVGNDLAIVTNGDINITNQVEFASTDGNVHTIYWIVPSGGGCGNVNFNNQTTWTNIRIFMFTPCNVNWTNKTSAVGQILKIGVAFQRLARLHSIAKLDLEKRVPSGRASCWASTSATYIYTSYPIPNIRSANCSACCNRPGTTGTRWLKWRRAKRPSVTCAISKCSGRS